MALELYMVGLATQHLDQSLAFYRRLGLAIPDGSEGQPHVEVKMSGGLTFFLNAKGQAGIADSPQLILEFYVKERAVVESKYAELTGFGYQSYRAPFVSPIGMYFAMVTDPDGHIILLSAD
jgi:catechol 2,3-dioxygenase-like lactoylglutathione lyase family enzyme